MRSSFTHSVFLITWASSDSTSGSFSLSTVSQSHVITNPALNWVGYLDFVSYQTAGTTFMDLGQVHPFPGPEMVRAMVETTWRMFQFSRAFSTATIIVSLVLGLGFQDTLSSRAGEFSPLHSTPHTNSRVSNSTRFKHNWLFQTRLNHVFHSTQLN